MTVDLVIAGVEYEARDLDDATPLCVAALGGRSEVMEALIKVGADVDSREVKGRTPVYLAACKRTFRCCQTAPSCKIKPIVDHDDSIGENFLAAGYCGVKW